MTERAAHRIVGELEASGYISRKRTGRRNVYAVRSDLPLPDLVPGRRRVRDLLVALGEGGSDG